MVPLRVCDIFLYDCDGNIIPEHDVNENGIIDCYEFAGCTDESACNFDPEAVQDDGSCTYPEIIYLCVLLHRLLRKHINDWDGDGICDNGIDLPVCLTLGHATTTRTVVEALMILVFAFTQK